MDKQFMKEYFDKMYEEPISAAVEDDSEYKSIREEYFQLEEELEKLLGGSDTEGYKLYDKVQTKSDEMWEHVISGVYLLGARDRERMLR